MARILTVSGWSFSSSNVLDLQVEGQTEVVGVSFNALKKHKTPDGSRLGFVVSFVAGPDGDNMLLREFNIYRSSGVSDEFLKGSTFLQHYGKKLYLLGGERVGDCWVVSNGSSVQALLEGYDKLARLLAYPVLFSAK
jgi:hypothetical protein